MASRLNERGGERAVSRTREPIRKEPEEMTTSEYLKEYLNMELPPKIAEFWDKESYVYDGLIFFDDAGVELVSGYWDFYREPFFDDKLAEFLSRYLFKGDPKYRIVACPGESSYRVDKEEGLFEFDVYDTEKHKLIFSGAVNGDVVWKKVNDNRYIEFIPSLITMKAWE